MSDSTTTFNDNFFPSSLFSDQEQKVLQSFLDGLDRDEDLNMGDVPVSQHPQHMSQQQLYATSFSTPYSRPVPSNFSPSAMNIPVNGRPAPVMLSSPSSLNTNYTSPQHFSTTPLTHPSPLDTAPSSSLPDPTKRAVTSKPKQADRRRNSKPYTNPNSDPSNPPIKSEPPPTPTRGPVKKPSRRKPAPASASPADSPPAGGQDDDMGSDDDKSASGGASSSRGGRGKKPPHELLTEAEKKANHIASEQKRRQNIRVGFDQLVDIVPTLSQCHRSEALILQKCEYFRIARVCMNKCGKEGVVKARFLCVCVGKV